MTLDEIKAEILADIEKREAALAEKMRPAGDGDAPVAAKDYQAPKLMKAVWTVGTTQFALTWQTDEGNSIVMMLNRGNGWVSWGGQEDYRGTILDVVTPEIIESRGTMLEFFQWLLADAERRANLVAGLSYPDPNDKVARARFVIENLLSVENNRPKLPAPPLGIAPK